MQTIVTYNEPLIRRAIFRFWVRFISWHGFAAIALWSVVCVWAVFWQTEKWITYGSLSLLLLGVTANFGVYFTYLGSSLKRFRRMNDPAAEVTISDDTFRIKSCVGETTLQWRVFEAIWRFPEAWLLFSGKTRFMILPIDTLGIEDRELMCEKVKENGGRIV
jgi:hypothetical protein